MCLTLVDSQYDPPLVAERVGWKIFEDYDGQLYPEFFGCMGELPVGKWLRSSDGDIAFYDTVYEQGFHCFTTEKDAKEYNWVYSTVVREVKIRGIVVAGHQQEAKCLVAKEMFILPVGARS